MANRPVLIVDNAPPDHEQRPRFVSPIDHAQTVRIMGEPQEVVDLYMTREEQRHLEAAAKRGHSRPFGEKLVEFFRWRGNLVVGIVIGFALASLLICAGAQLIIWWGLVR